MIDIVGNPNFFQKRDRSKPNDLEYASYIFRPVCHNHNSEMNLWDAYEGYDIDVLTQLAADLSVDVECVATVPLTLRKNAERFTNEDDMNDENQPMWFHAVDLCTLPPRGPTC